MKIVIAPDSYKESLSALQVANAIEKGFKHIFPNATYLKVPVADGGEGTVDTMIEATAGKKIELAVVGALGTALTGFGGISGDSKVAFIEVAAACGIEQVPAEQRNPLITTTYGVGELILSALDLGVRHFIVGLGGSATNDGGAGMLQALGAKLLDEKGKQLGYGGAELIRLAKIDLSEFDPRLKECRFDVACDVTNPLVGEKGASAIFGPQKGATPEMVKQLDQALNHYADVIADDLHVEVKNIPGAGAAGGLGAAFAGVLKAELKSGIGIITELLKLEEKMKDANLVITGEGRLDHQSINGKVPVGVAAVAKRHNIPVIGIAGSLGQDIDVVYEYGLDAVFSVLNKVCSLTEALEPTTAAMNLEITARNIAATLKMNMA
ncbi:glycerate 2-kinase [Pasteurella langaaensis DSM 22999]|uniref:Glycerate 2-kinase n=1 Tax=Alitibacter langaaensis DSM 22999 TaxID=1122935 RepID=A0A2U0TGY8_9PAST|nr:glycerate kinase [Pasteurella langaaensis]PVX42886.1 glycerate 2-kinase [Pasteurella langaaensis DSM 22999]